MPTVFVVPPITFDANTTPEKFILSRYQVDLHDWLAEKSLPLHRAARAVTIIAETALHLHRSRQLATTELNNAIHADRLAEVQVYNVIPSARAAHVAQRSATTTVALASVLAGLAAQQGATLAALDVAMTAFAPADSPSTPDPLNR